MQNFVLKGISPPQEIQRELEESGFKVHCITNMVSRATMKPLPMFKIALESVTTCEHIQGVRRLGLFRVKIEAFKRKRKPPRCTNCLKLNHTAGRCKALPKCKTCTKNHHTKNCTTSPFDRLAAQIIYHKQQPSESRPKIVRNIAKNEEFRNTDL